MVEYVADLKTIEGYTKKNLSVLIGQNDWDLQAFVEKPIHWETEEKKDSVSFDATLSIVVNHYAVKNEINDFIGMLNIYFADMKQIDMKTKEKIDMLLKETAIPYLTYVDVHQDIAKQELNDDKVYTYPLKEEDLHVVVEGYTIENYLDTAKKIAPLLSEVVATGESIVTFMNELLKNHFDMRKEAIATKMKKEYQRVLSLQLNTNVTRNEKE